PIPGPPPRESSPARSTAEPAPLLPERVAATLPPAGQTSPGRTGPAGLSTESCRFRPPPPSARECSAAEAARRAAEERGTSSRTAPQPVDADGGAPGRAAGPVRPTREAAR